MMTIRIVLPVLAAVVVLTWMPVLSAAQPVSPSRAVNSAPAAAQPSATSISLPSDYVIGVEDRLGVVFWREQDKGLTTDVVVRPDGKISVPMLNDISAAGLTPEQLAIAVQEAAARYIRDAAATVIVREIHSRKVFVIGEVSKPGTVQLGSEMNVLQVIAEAGGFLEHANKSDIAIVRTENGQERRFKFNYKEVVKGKKPEQNIRLRPGDTVLVR
jgi:polysaccharide export outer membrane protein